MTVQLLVHSNTNDVEDAAVEQTRRVSTTVSTVGLNQVPGSITMETGGRGAHLLPQLLVFGLQTLAVSTPRSVELDQHVFAVVVDEVVEVLGDGDLTTDTTDESAAE